MCYADTYKDYLSQLKNDVQLHTSREEMFVFGYTSDLDVVLKWDEAALNAVLSKHLKENPTVRDREEIDSYASLARVMAYYMINGLGGEIDITNYEVCQYLENQFAHQYALGGTCAQGATALNAVGFPVVVHITDMSREVCAQMDHPGIQVVTSRGLRPIMQAATEELPVRHIILQYPKGAKIQVLGEEYTIPVSNRLIIDFDTVHKRLPLDPQFISFCEKNAKNIIAYSISGFNLIVDSEAMEKHADELCTHYNKIKKENPSCVIYLEGACYLNSEVKNLVFDKLAESVDILGMNEEELVDHTAKYGVSTKIDDLDSVLSGLDFLLKTYPSKAIVMHTKDYAIYYGDEIRGINPEKGLTLGNLMSGTRARIGEYGTIADCEETLKIALSPKGVAFASKTKRIQSDRKICLVPSRYMERPKYTIGLGDTFMAGFMAGAGGA